MLLNTELDFEKKITLFISLVSILVLLNLIFLMLGLLKTLRNMVRFSVFYYGFASN